MASPEEQQHDEDMTQIQVARELDTPVITLEEFREAQRDPAVIKFLADARRYGERMEAEGRIHP